MRLYEATSIFSDNLDEIIVAVSTNLEHNIAVFKMNHAGPVKETKLRSFTRELITYHFIQRMYGTQIRLLRNLIMVRNNKNSPRKTTAITSETIERAKEYPIEELYVGNLHRSGNSLRGICPFHTERTNSFFIKPETNRFKCFGCNVSGDAIDYYMKVNGMKKKEFYKAVRFLSKI